MSIGLDIGRSGLKGVGAERLFLLPVFVHSTEPPGHPLRTEPMVKGVHVRSVHVQYRGETWLLGEDAERPGGRGHYRKMLPESERHRALHCRAAKDTEADDALPLRLMSF